MKITDYTEVQKFDTGDILLKDGTNGTKTIGADDLLIAALDAAGLTQMHRNVYRGKNLGSTLTSAQKAAIAAETWDDLFVGDYWLINDIHWRIADINYWKHTGDTEFVRPHLVIVPDENLGEQKMEDTNTTANGYYGSKMVSKYLSTAIGKVNSAFGDAVLEHRVALSNASSNGHASGSSWYTRKVDLLTENMVYGSKIMGSMGDGSFIINNDTNSISQLALFALKPDSIATRYTYWLQDVSTSAYFAVVFNNGAVGFSNASVGRGVRVAFAIG